MLFQMVPRWFLGSEMLFIDIDGIHGVKYELFNRCSDETGLNKLDIG